MPKARVSGVELEYAEAGSGFPLIFCHEFAGSMESWEPQVHFFARRYRVITYNSRGYWPSEVPSDPNAYSQDIAVEDLYGLIRHLGIEQAHIAGLSMGGSLALHFGIRHPEHARSLIVSSAGSGSDNPDEFRASSRATADRFEREGASTFEGYSTTATRVQLRRKDPTGFEEFQRLLRAHSTIGSAHTMRGVQAGRPPIYVWEQEMRALQVPTLVLVGDEDEPCIEPSLFMKRNIPSCGLAVLPQSGHCINLEEPDLFNRLCWDFLTQVEAGKWDRR